jgi:hypothetical protein
MHNEQLRDPFEPCVENPGTQAVHVWMPPLTIGGVLYLPGGHS